MSDYIDRQATLKNLEIKRQDALMMDDLRRASIIMYGMILGEEAVRNQPSVDAVEVVRCKDCRWYKTNYSWNGNEHRICAKEPYEPVRSADDFCSYGERNDG